MSPRLFAVVPNSTLPTNVKHYHGAPPEITGGPDTRRELGLPQLLIVEEKTDGIFLYRYNLNGECVGDTWHTTLADAQHQAEHEYDGLALSWREVPENIEDAAAFGLVRANVA